MSAMMNPAQQMAWGAPQNQYNMGMGMMPQGYYNPMDAQMQQDVPGANLLSEEEQKEIAKVPAEFQTKLTRVEFLRCICTHRDKHGIYKIEELPADEIQNEGYGQHCRCSICGAEWHMLQADTALDFVDHTIDLTHDILQTAKTYITCPPQSMKEYYMIIPLLLRLKQLWRIAIKNADKTFGQFNQSLSANEDQYNMQILGRIFGAPGMAATIPGFNYGQNPYFAASQVANPQMNPQFNPMMANGQQTMMPGMGQFNTTSSGIAVPSNQFAATQQPQYQQAPQQQMYGMAQSNPIGYVDNTPDFTQMKQAQQQTATQQQTVSMPGPVANANTQQAPAMPAAPQNPNLKNPDQKANVNKNFPM